MAKAIETIGALKVGHFGLGQHGAGIGSVKQQVHDGDTVIVRALGNLSVRFLGVDKPEISFRLPGSTQFDSIGGDKWQTFLNDPLSDRWGVIDLAPPLRAYIAQRVGPGCAANHHRHAQSAQRALETDVEADLAAAGGSDEKSSRESFRFFLAFADEVMDGYGRLLGYVNRDQQTHPRPRSYNERLLQQGWAMPYFIWPNVNPFRKQKSVIEAVPVPGTAALLAQRENSLREARLAVRVAREAGIALFDKNDPLRLAPFELRYLASRSAPSRWVISLASDGDVILPPQRYFEIENPEDRLFIPAQFVPLFVERGWRRGAGV